MSGRGMAGAAFVFAALGVLSSVIPVAQGMEGNRHGLTAVLTVVALILAVGSVWSRD